MPGTAVSTENAGQAAAIAARKRAVAVIAGPGSGKTRTLVSRIEALLQEGVPAAQITAVTFTNQAAREMRERLETLLGNKRALSGMTIGTFHSVCLRLLHDLSPKTLLSREESDRLLGRVLQTLGLDIPLKTAAELLSAARSDIGDPADPNSAALRSAYEAALRADNLRDLDGLLLEALRTPVADPAMFRHLLVDEYQDINAVQRRLVCHWAQQSDSLFVIGDPDQSIYGFRGASASCFDDLRAEYPDLRIIRLHKNYRSTPEICRAAQNIICHNPGGERSFEPVMPSGAPVRLLRAASPHSEATAIAKEIARMTGGLDMLEAARFEPARSVLRSFSDIAVLCRTHRQLSLIEEHLRRDDIPVITVGRDQWLQDEKVLSALRFLRLLAPGQRETPRRILEKWIAEHGSNAAMQSLLQSCLLFKDVPALLDALLLGEEADVPRAAGKACASGAVRLMTIHGAKGLEFPVIFLAGLTQDLFPPHAAEDSLAEERRLLFVGMTRAREELVVSCAEPPSVFIPELSPCVVEERVRTRPQAQQLSLF